jgi:solute:Na+ symporter, SSS family
VTPLLAAIAAYLLLQFVIGATVLRRIATVDDYLIAGRRLGPWLATASIFATWFGAETIVGGAAMVHRDGLSLATVEPFGYGLCIVLTGLVFAVPLWRRRLTTLADLYRERYGTGIERLAALLLVPGSLLWAAAQLRAFAQVISVSGTAISFDVALLAAGAIVIAYTMVGGMLADAITDLLQAGVLLVALLVLGVVVIAEAGGPGAALAAVQAADTVSLLPRERPGTLALIEAWAVPLCGSVVATELVSRIIAARTPGVARGAALGAGTLYLLIGSIPVLLALLAAPVFGLTLADAEQVIPTLAREQLPPWLYVVFAGGLVSAILSTVDSTLLVAAGIGAHNIVLPQLRRQDDRTKVRVTRGFVALGGLIALLLARSAEGVFALVEEASSFGSAGLLVTVSFALFSRVGGALAAGGALLGGLLGYLALSAAAVTAPFLGSLLIALLAYLAGAVVDARRQR